MTSAVQNKPQTKPATPASTSESVEPTKVRKPRTPTPALPSGFDLAAVQVHESPTATDGKIADRVHESPLDKHPQVRAWVKRAEADKGPMKLQLPSKAHAEAVVRLIRMAAREIDRRVVFEEHALADGAIGLRFEVRAKRARKPRVEK